MTNGDNGPGDGRPSRALATEEARFADGADLTNLTLKALSLQGVVARQAFFAGSLFRGCTFTRCDFARSDFEGVVFEDCTFRECNLAIADFRSADVARTSFVECSFDEGSIRTSTFSDTEFDRCRFFQQSFQENRLTRCTLSGCTFQRSTMLLVDFRETTFVETDLADCTSLYHRFSRCTFQRCQINAELVGLSYGLTRENLEGMGLTWFGKKLERPRRERLTLVDALLTTFSARTWQFAASILALNFGMASVTTALEAALVALFRESEPGKPLKADEIRFFETLVDRLASVGKLPFLAIARGLDHVARAADRVEGPDLSALRSLHHALKEAEASHLVELDGVLNALAGLQRVENSQLTFVLDEKPAAPLLAWLEQIHRAMHLKGQPPTFVDARAGSYIETARITNELLGYAVLTLALCGHVVDRLTILRKKLAKFLYSKPPAVLKRRALQSPEPISARLASDLRACLEMMEGSDGQRIASTAEALIRHLQHLRIEDDNGPAPPRAGKRARASQKRPK